jgi:hypothetical protein
VSDRRRALPSCLEFDDTRKWLHGLRAQQATQDGLGGLLGEAASHGQPTPEQLATLQAHFASGGHQQATVTRRPLDAERVAEEVERRYWTHEVKARQPVNDTSPSTARGGWSSSTPSRPPIRIGRRRGPAGWPTGWA